MRSARRGPYQVEKIVLDPLGFDLCFPSSASLHLITYSQGVQRFSGKVFRFTGELGKIYPILGISHLHCRTVNFLVIDDTVHRIVCFAAI